MCWMLSHNSQLVFGGSRQGCNEMSYTPSQLAKSAFCLQPLCGMVRTRYELPTSLIGSCCNRKKWSVTVIERLLCLGKLLIRKTIASSSLYVVSLIVLLLAGLISLARILTCESKQSVALKWDWCYHLALAFNWKPKWKWLPICSENLRASFFFFFIYD